MNDEIKTTNMNSTSTQQEIQLAIYNKLENMSQEQLLALNLIVDQIKQSNITTNDILNKISNALSGVKVIEKEKIVKETKEVVKEISESEAYEKYIKEKEAHKRTNDYLSYIQHRFTSPGCCARCGNNPLRGANGGLSCLPINK